MTIEDFRYIVQQISVVGFGNIPIYGVYDLQEKRFICTAYDKAGAEFIWQALFDLQEAKEEIKNRKEFHR